MLFTTYVAHNANAAELRFERSLHIPQHLVSDHSHNSDPGVTFVVEKRRGQKNQTKLPQEKRCQPAQAQCFSTSRKQGIKGLLD